MVRHRQRSEEPPVSSRLLGDVRARARPLAGVGDLGPLLDRVGDARCVLLGEASHGTHEYYQWRAEISKRLIQEKGFSFIAVEGDWPDCYRVNRYVKGSHDDGEDATDVLAAFERWPTWMWANEEIVELAEWMREYNADRPEAEKVGFYGLDVYSLWDSLYQVTAYLGKHGGQAAQAARQALRCFEPYGEDEQQYARATRWVDETCEQDVVELLRQVRAQAAGGAGDREAHFVAEQK